uniref:C2 NT-type domain-containing protein n=1 Tax=Heterorhabditis bacteriophora TaxID=37862 RepID=A0A1I7XAK8_HETBA
MSSSGSDESVAQRTVAISVIKDTGSKVELMFKVHGLKKRKSLLNSIVTVFKKANSPSRLLSNGKFTRFDLNAHSIYFSLDVQTEKKMKKGNGNRTDTFVCEIRQFPTTINPDSAEFEVLEPASGECFIVLSLIKVDNLAVNWKEFLDSNGTLDVTCI